MAEEEYVMDGYPVAFSAFRDNTNLNDIVVYCYKREMPRDYKKYIAHPVCILETGKEFYRKFYHSERSRAKSPVNKIQIKADCTDEYRKTLLSFRKKLKKSRKSPSRLQSDTNSASFSLSFKQFCNCFEYERVVEETLRKRVVLSDENNLKSLTEWNEIAHEVYENFLISSKKRKEYSLKMKICPKSFKVKLSKFLESGEAISKPVEHTTSAAKRARLTSHSKSKSSQRESCPEIGALNVSPPKLAKIATPSKSPTMQNLLAEKNATCSDSSLAFVPESLKENLPEKRRRNISVVKALQSPKQVVPQKLHHKRIIESDTNSESFSLSFNQFCKCFEYERVVEKILRKRLGLRDENNLKGLTEWNEIAHEVYENFLTSSEKRKEYSLKMKCCPNSCKAKISKFLESADEISKPVEHTTSAPKRARLTSPSESKSSPRESCTEIGALNVSPPKLAKIATPSQSPTMQNLLAEKNATCSDSLAFVPELQNSNYAVNTAEKFQGKQQGYPVTFQTFLMHTNIKRLAEEQLKKSKNEIPNAVDVNNVCLRMYEEFYSKPRRNKKILHELFVRADFAGVILEGFRIAPREPPIIQSVEIIPASVQSTLKRMENPSGILFDKICSKNSNQKQLNVVTVVPTTVVHGHCGLNYDCLANGSKNSTIFNPNQDEAFIDANTSHAENEMNSNSATLDADQLIQTETQSLSLQLTKPIEPSSESALVPNLQNSAQLDSVPELIQREFSVTDPKAQTNNFSNSNKCAKKPNENIVLEEISAQTRFSQSKEVIVERDASKTGLLNEGFQSASNVDHLNNTVSCENHNDRVQLSAQRPNPDVSSIPRETHQFDHPYTKRPFENQNYIQIVSNPNQQSETSSGITTISSDNLEQEESSQRTNSGSTNRTESNSSGSILKPHQELPSNCKTLAVQCNFPNINDFTQIQSQSLLRPNNYILGLPDNLLQTEENVNSSYFISMPNTQLQSEALNVDRSINESVLDPLNATNSITTTPEAGNESCSENIVTNKISETSIKTELTVLVPPNNLKFVLNDSNSNFQIENTSEEIVTVDDSQENNSNILFSNSMCANLNAFIQKENTINIADEDTSTLSSEEEFLAISERNIVDLCSETQDVSRDANWVLNNSVIKEPSSVFNHPETCVENPKPTATKQINKDVPQLTHKFGSLPLQKQSKKKHIFLSN